MKKIIIIIIAVVLTRKRKPSISWLSEETVAKPRKWS